MFNKKETNIQIDIHKYLEKKLKVIWLDYQKHIRYNIPLNIISSFLLFVLYHSIDREYTKLQIRHKGTHFSFKLSSKNKKELLFHIQKIILFPETYPEKLEFFPEENIKRLAESLTDALYFFTFSHAAVGFTFTAEFFREHKKWIQSTQTPVYL